MSRGKKSAFFVPALMAAMLSAGIFCKGRKDATAAGLTPDKLNPEQVISVADLKKAYFAWNGKTVSVYGYPQYLIDQGMIQKEISLMPAPFSKWVLNCSLAVPVAETGLRDKPVVLQGVVQESPYDMVNLGGCKLVSAGEIATVAPTLDIKPEQPMNAVDFVKTYNAWKGKKVTVSGNYHSTTTSTTAYGKTIRVDLADAAGNKCVGADFAEDPSDKLKDNRENVQMLCEIKGTVFDTVNLTACKLLNR
jgi:hypothetical protein